MGCKCNADLFAKSDAETLILKLAKKLDETLSRVKVSVVIEETADKITSTTTYSDGSTSVDIVNLDESGDVVSAVENGHEYSVTYL